MYITCKTQLVGANHPHLVATLCSDHFGGKMDIHSFSGVFSVCSSLLCWPFKTVSHRTWPSATGPQGNGPKLLATVVYVCFGLFFWLVNVGKYSHMLHGNIYMWLKFMVNVGKYSIHGAFGIDIPDINAAVFVFSKSNDSSDEQWKTLLFRVNRGLYYPVI